MARPNKQGLDYFPFDVDFFDDEKIEAISGEFGIKGEITAIKLLCAIYRNGYFIQWNDMLKMKLLKNLPGISSELLENIVNRLVKWDFFDKNLFDSMGILTSRGIQMKWMKRTELIENEFLSSPTNLIIDVKIPQYKKNVNSRIYNKNVKKWYSIIKDVFKRDNYICQYCRKIGGKLEADHIIPFSKGGSDDISNLTTSCRRCNRQKKDKSVEEFLKWKEHHE